MSDDGPEWFAPKRYGYGAGLPIAWQGWLVLGVYIAVIAIAARFLPARPIEILAIVVPATTILLVITAKTTRGGWRWRWGDDGR
jgi:hypothetical protein